MVTAAEPVLLVPSQIREAGDVLARAFMDDPLCTYLIPDDRKRARSLSWFMTSFVRYCHPFGAVYTTAGTIEGVAIRLPPGHTKVTLMGMVKGGALAGPFQVGLASTLRFLNFVNFLEKYHDREMPSRHWYCVWLGVDPPSRGRGIGRALAQPVFSRADEEGLPCYLQNTKEVNLPFHQRNGFEVVSQLEVPNGGPRIWTMRREPRRRE